MKHWRFGFVAAFAALVVAVPGARAASADDVELAGMNLEDKGDIDGAIVKYREAVTLAPKNKAFKENLANTLNKAAIAKHNAKDDAAAIALLEEAVAFVPNFKPALQSLGALKSGKLMQEGVALVKNGDFANAIPKFDAVLAADPDNKAAKINKDVAESQIAMATGDPATAVAKLQDAVALDPSRQFLKDKLTEAQTAAASKSADDAKKAAEEAKTKK